MSDLVWLGEREVEDNNPPSPPGDVTVSTAGKSATAAAKKSRQLAGSRKRFTHVFCRRWALPEGLLSAAKGGGGGGDARARTPATVAAASVAPERAAGERKENDGDCDERPKGAKALFDLSLSVGDMVCVSAQGGGGAFGPRRGGGGGRGRGSGLDEVRLLTGNVSAVYEDRVEVRSEKRMRVPRRGRKHRGGGCGGAGGRGGEAGDALDIEDLLGTEGRPGQEELAEETVYFRIDKDEWAAGIA